MPDEFVIQNSSALSSYQPEDVLSKNQYYQQWMKQRHPDWSSSDIGNYNDFGYRVSKFFGDADRSHFDSAYESYLANVNNRNEYKAIQSARAWDEYMANTQYQRAMKDLEKAGLNPYLLVSGGNTPAADIRSGSSSKANYKSPENKTKSNDGDAKDLALILLAIGRLAAKIA